MKPIYSILLYSMSLLLGTSELYSAVVWQAPVDIVTGDSVVSTNGTYIEGLNFQEFGSASENYTVNGVEFLGGQPSASGIDPATLAYTSSMGSFSITNIDRDGDADFGPFATGAEDLSPDWDSLSPEMQGILRGVQWCTDATTVTVTLNDLAPGAEYEVQLFVNDSREYWAGGKSTAFTDGEGNESGPILHNTGSGSTVRGSTGQTVLGTFIAGASGSQVIETVGAGILNAIQLRQISAPPAGSISWADPVNIIDGDTIVSTNGKYIEALNFQEYGSALENYTVNGVEFLGGQPGASGVDPAALAYTSSMGSFSITNIDRDGDADFGPFATGAQDLSPDWDSLSPEMQGILRGVQWCTDATTVTITLNDLIPGETYEIQLFVNDSREYWAGGKSTAFTDGKGNESGPVLHNTGSGATVRGSTGQSVIGTFVADESGSQMVETVGAGILNAIQLRHASAVLEGVISWATPVNISTGDSIVSTNGLYIEGLNMQEFGSPVENYTVNGVEFLGGQPSSGGIDPTTLAYNSALGSFSITNIDRDGDAAMGPFATGAQDLSPDWASLSTEMQGILTGAQWCTGDATIRVTLNNLTPGESYEIQLFVNDSREYWAGGKSVVFVDDKGNQSPSVSINTGSGTTIRGSVGQAIVGTFVADESGSQMFESVNGGLLNAVQLRQTSVTPTGVISWSNPVDIVGGDFIVSTTGAYVEGLNMQEFGSPVENYSINGVEFLGGQPSSGGIDPTTLAYDSSLGSFSITNIDRDGDAAMGPFATGSQDLSPDWGSLSPEMQGILTSAQWCTGDATIRVTLNNLTPGETYEIQLFVNDSREYWAGGKSVVFTDDKGNQSPAVSINTGTGTTIRGSVGQAIIGTFVADESGSQMFESVNGGLLNAVQLRHASAIPTGIISWATPVNIVGGDPIVSTNGTYVEGLNMQEFGSPVENHTINGVQFLGGQPNSGGVDPATLAYDSALGSFSITNIDRDGDAAMGPFATGSQDLSPDWDSLSAEMQGILIGAQWATGDATIRVTLNNLTPAAKYEIQLFVNDSREYWAGGKSVVFSDDKGNTSPAVSINTGTGTTIRGSVGQAIIGTFYADESGSQMFESLNGGLLNAVQLRLLEGPSGGSGNTEGSVAGAATHGGGELAALFEFATGSLDNTAPTVSGVSSVTSMALSVTAQSDVITEAGFEDTLRFDASKVTSSNTDRYAEFTINFAGDASFGNATIRIEHEQSASAVGNASTFEVYTVDAANSETLVLGSTLGRSAASPYTSDSSVQTVIRNVDTSSPLTIRIYARDVASAAGANFGLAWLTVALDAPVEHPFLLFRQEDVQALRDKSSVEPYSSWKTDSINWANQINPAVGNHYSLRQAAQTCALSYVLDPDNAASYVTTFMDAIDKWPATLDALNPEGGDWSNNIPVAASLVGAILGLDAIYPALSEAERVRAHDILDVSVNRIAQTSHARSYYGLHYIWNRFRGAASDASDDLELYKQRVFRNGENPWMQGGASAYEWARNNGQDRELSKALPMDVASHLGDHDFYNDPRMQEYMDFMINYTMGPKRMVNAYGDSDPYTRIGRNSAFEGFRNITYGNFGERLASEYAWYGFEGQDLPVAVNASVAQYVLHKPWTEIIEPSSRYWMNAGGNLWEENPTHENLHASIWSAQIEPHHSHYDTNGITLHAFGENVLSNSGYGGFVADLPTITWEDTTVNAVSNNSATINGENHSNSIGGGVIDAFLNDGIDFVTTTSGIALGADSTHDRTLALVDSSGSNAGYFVVIDSFERSGFSGDVQTYWHPPSAAVSEIEASRHYRYDLPSPTNSSEVFGRLDFFFGGNPTVSIVQGGTATFNLDLRTREEKYLKAESAISGGAGRTVTVILPNDSSITPPTLASIANADDKTVRFEYESGVMDTIAVDGEVRTTALDGVDWAGESLIYRIGPDSEFVNQSVGINVTRIHRNGIGIESTGPIDVFIKDWEIKVNTTSEETLTLSGVASRALMINGDPSHAQSVNGDVVEVVLPVGEHVIEVDSAGFSASFINTFTAIGEEVEIASSIDVNNAFADYRWYLNGEELAFAAGSPILSIASLGEEHVGLVHLEVTYNGIVEVSNAFWLGPKPEQAYIINTSVRNKTEIGDNTLMFETNLKGYGSNIESTLIRAAGPSLTREFGMENIVVDPSLAVFEESELVASNDDWGTSPDAGELEAAATLLGAFSFDTGSTDSALAHDMKNGSYTAVASGDGITLIEFYTMEQHPDDLLVAPKIVNASARNQVGVEHEVLIMGVVIVGEPGITKKLLIRGVGPSLVSIDSGLSGLILEDPMLKLFKEEVEIAENDDWSDDVELASVMTAAGAFQYIVGSKDAAIVVELEPGEYTAILSGKEENVGVGLIEFYDVDDVE